MRTFLSAVLLAALVGWVTEAHAVVMRAEDADGNYIRLFDAPCANDVVRSRTPSELRSQLRAGEASIHKKLYGLCWVALPDGSVGVLYDGDQGRLPIQLFRPEVGA